MPLLFIIACRYKGLCKRLVQGTVLALAGWPVGSVVFAAEIAHPTGRYALSRPESWQADTSPTRDTTILRSAPVDTYMRGGLLPTGAAEIIVQIMPPALDPSAEIDRLTRGASSVDRSFHDGQDRAAYTYELGPGITYREVHLLFLLAGRSIAMTLRYHDNDATAAEYLKVFDAVRRSLEVGPSTP